MLQQTQIVQEQMYFNQPITSAHTATELTSPYVLKPLSSGVKGWMCGDVLQKWGKLTEKIEIYGFSWYVWTYVTGEKKIIEYDLNMTLKGSN